MIRKICIIVQIAAFLLTLNGLSRQEINDVGVNYTSKLFADYSMVQDPLEEYDYYFEGTINSLISVSQYNENGTEIPYSYFNVDIVNVYKGVISSDQVVIKFYGGYDQENNLILIDGLNYPVIGDQYSFYVNKTKMLFEEDGRTIENSFPVSCPSNMIAVNGENNVDGSLSLNITAYFSIDGGDGGGTSNTTIETARTIDVGDSMLIYIAPGVEKYYKYTATDLNYVSFYSTGDKNTTVEVYYSNGDSMGTSYSSISRELSYTGNSTNFFAQFYADIGETYYFKVFLASSTSSGLFYINLMIDNYYQSDLDSLVLGHDSVDGSNKIDYTLNTSYASEALAGIAEWNKLGSVTLHKDDASTTNDVVVSDYNDPDSRATAYYQQVLLLADRIKYNTFHFNLMTADERMRTILHEFGHALGINEFTGLESTVNVMYQGICATTKLGPADIGVYRELWG